MDANVAIMKEDKPELKSHDNMWQKLMDEAYEGWRTNAPASSYNQFIDQLTDLHKNAVLLGNLNYQVQNGGISQWIDNGYCTQINEVIELLRTNITAYPIFDKIVDILMEVEPLLDGSDYSELRKPEISDDQEEFYQQCIEKGLEEEMQRLTNIFNRHQEQFEIDCHTFIEQEIMKVESRKYYGPIAKEILEYIIKEKGNLSEIKIEDILINKLGRHVR